jgi:23S rRNA pseudouridine1911/1915/1917 synthase
MLVCNKRSGILSQSDNDNNESILDHAKSYLKKRYKKAGDAFIGLVHRLDRPSSGALILAKTSKALERLNESFRNRITHKYYVCMVNGKLEDQGKCINYMMKDKDNKRVRCYDDKKHIKYGNVIEAELRYKSILCKTFNINDNEISQSLIDIEMETGRKHQIRCQMAHLGMLLFFHHYHYFYYYSKVIL